MSTSIRHTELVDLHCSCLLPEEEGDKMAESDVYKTWFHQHCMDIPDRVFDNTEVPLSLSLSLSLLPCMSCFCLDLIWFSGSCILCLTFHLHIHILL